MAVSRNHGNWQRGKLNSVIYLSTPSEECNILLNYPCCVGYPQGRSLTGGVHPFRPNLPGSCISGSKSFYLSICMGWFPQGGGHRVELPGTTHAPRPSNNPG